MPDSGAPEDPLYALKGLYSVALLIFSIVVITALQIDEQTKIAESIHPIVAIALMWGALLWLSMVEGGQASMVGLPPVDRNLYKESHPISHAICEWGHKGDNLDRYLMGRQFMVLALVFCINNSGAPSADADVLGLPEWVSMIMLEWGFAMILLTCMVGQLNTQVNASHCMLDYINTHFMTFTLYVAMAIEFSGLLHASYFFQLIVAMMAGKPIESNEPPRSEGEAFFFWIRVLGSVCILAFCLGATLVALFEGKTTMWESVPDVIAIILFFGLMSVVGMLEGMQIAFFAVAKITEEERNKSPWAKATCDLLFKGDGHNLPGFMIGRQLCVVSCFFIVARVTTMEIEEGETNVLDVPDPIQEFFNTGLMGALITTIIASIAWQLVASAFPLAFLSTPITYFLLRICLFLESTGICNGAWVLASIHKQIAGFQKDEVYIGTAEERAAMKLAEGQGLDGAGHLAGGAWAAVALGGEIHVAGSDEAVRATLQENVKILRTQVKESSTEEEREVFQKALDFEVEKLDKRFSREHPELVDAKENVRILRGQLVDERTTDEQREVYEKTLQSEMAKLGDVDDAALLI